MDNPGGNCRHEWGTDKACGSLTHFVDVRASNEAVLKEIYFIFMLLNSSKGCCEMTSSTVNRSQDGSKGLEAGGK
jgi:hypothetical protein